MRFILIGMVLLAAGCGSRSTDDWLQQLKDPDVLLRRQALRALEKRTEQPELVVPAIVEALRDSDGYVRRDAATVLGMFGAEAKSAAPALHTALKDKDKRVHKAAAAALKKIEPDRRVDRIQ